MMVKQTHELAVSGVLVCATMSSEHEGLQVAEARFAKGEACGMEVDMTAMKASTAASEHLSFRRIPRRDSVANRSIQS